MGFILFIVAIILTPFVFAIGFVFVQMWFLAFGNLKELNKYWKDNAISIDKLGNGSCGYFLQMISIKKKHWHVCHQFGNIRETASFCYGQNKYLNEDYLSSVGRLICKILNTLERDHVEKAISVQKENDKRSMERYINDDYARYETTN